MTQVNKQRLIEGYQKLAHRTHDLLLDTKSDSGERLKNALLTAQDEITSLKELTKMEAEQIAGWIKRDLHAMNQFFAQTKQEVKEWLPVEIDAEEKYLFERLKSVADKTTVELQQLREQAEFAAFDLWRTGGVTSAGILKCTQCGEQLHFKKTGHIPPCPKCHNSTFARIADDIPEESLT